METQSFCLKLTLDSEDALKRVWAESAWRVAVDTDEHLLTPDNERLVSQMMKEGFDEICSRLSGYIELASFNNNATTGNIILWLRFRHYWREAVSAAIAADIVEALAQYALMRFYGDVGYYGVAWRRALAHVLLILARDANDIGGAA